IADMIRLQNDNVSLPARALVPLLAAAYSDSDNPEAKNTEAAARRLLLSWNDSVDADSPAAGIYEMWQRRVIANVRNGMVPKEVQTFIGPLSMKKIIDWLDAPDGRFGSDPIRGRDELLTRSLTEAVAELTKKLGPDVNGWRWGQADYHHATI